jgi:hypothetical protein
MRQIPVGEALQILVSTCRIQEPGLKYRNVPPSTVSGKQELGKLSDVMEERYVQLSKAGCTDLQGRRRVMGA